MSAPVSVLVTGANGLVGSAACAALAERGVRVRALVRRSGTAPQLDGLEELVGDFADPRTARAVLEGAGALVTTVHPMGSDLATQQRIGVEGTEVIARAAAEAGLERHVHLSTTAAYDRRPGVGDVDESSDLAADDAGDYAVTKRDTDRAIAAVEGTTRILVRPPCILGPGPTSVWNTLRPRQLREDPGSRHAVAEETWAWVHVRDLAAFIADAATGALTGPEPGGCTAVNVAGGSDTWRDYLGTVAGALGVEVTWDDQPAWTGRILTERAASWGWAPQVGLDDALAELDAEQRTER
ncbi:NAD-dependent epimerase/dehydratase family protein [Nocardioides mangrovicus]|uniref:NAD-dependent epimerase/dehydratase family protein n=1 Tax=Nocardioides mangrovicus TaxID=2478913 RepID=A0A3L8P6I4_9ACTN|nr:NAD-dependent epimerase/dehydratase family protein [Nocardioides mangrovicus]RLV50875.1 NAD-dependent epimerase/dehydratase family protein [Nocardioides mangrovicus]